MCKSSWSEKDVYSRVLVGTRVRNWKHIRHTVSFGVLDGICDACWSVLCAHLAKATLTIFILKAANVLIWPARPVFPVIQFCVPLSSEMNGSVAVASHVPLWLCKNVLPLTIVFCSMKYKPQDKIVRMILDESKKCEFEQCRMIKMQCKIWKIYIHTLKNAVENKNTKTFVCLQECFLEFIDETQYLKNYNEKERHKNRHRYLEDKAFIVLFVYVLLRKDFWHRSNNSLKTPPLKKNKTKIPV